MQVTMYCYVAAGTLFIQSISVKVRAHELITHQSGTLLQVAPDVLFVCASITHRSELELQELQGF